MKNKIVYLFILVLFSACASLHTGAISSGPLLSANDRYVDAASGYASATYFLGIGGLSKNHLVYDAKKDMMNNRPLKKGEYYANFTVDFDKTISFISWVTNEVFVHADVLSTNIDTALSTNNVKQLNVVENKPILYVKVGQDTFYVGEKIFYRYHDDYRTYDFQSYIITSFISQEKASLRTLDKEKSITANTSEFMYSMDKIKNGFACGDSVIYDTRSYLSDKKVIGKIIGISIKNALVMEGKKTRKIQYDELTKIKPANK